MEKRAVQAGAVLAALGAALQLAARNIAGFGEWYGGNVYPLLVGTLGRLSGLFPFSVSEMGLYVLAVAFLVFAVKNRKNGCGFRRSCFSRPPCCFSSTRSAAVSIITGRRSP